MGRIEVYELLCILDFNNDRKRMSVSNSYDWYFINVNVIYKNVIIVWILVICLFINVVHGEITI